LRENRYRALPPEFNGSNLQKRMHSATAVLVPERKPCHFSAVPLLHEQSNPAAAAGKNRLCAA